MDRRRDPASARAGVLLLALVAATVAGCSTARGPVVAARELPLVPASPTAAVPQPAPPPIEETAPIEEAPAVEHVVAPGETLWRIARAYDVDPRALARANELADPDRIDVGQRLVVPGATRPLAQPVSHVSQVADLFVWPVAGRRVLSPFGAPRGSRRHAGVDLAGSHGDAVMAIEAGRVLYSGSSLGGYGKTVILDHGGGLRSLYAHNADLFVEVGQDVVRGATIARVGRSGNATTDHLHFEIRRNGVAVDPLGLFPSDGGAVGGAGD
jgi:murein DD-endopeptidase MepM/ murein hydrolase activator NlpD